jgi:protein-L-isoaspartate(D-aspartate) O-methyltransferase
MNRGVIHAMWPLLAGMMNPQPWENAGAADRFAEARREMSREQFTGLGRSITNSRVLAVMESLPRHEFVPEQFRESAYQDHPLPIGHGQTISQPYVVAFMTQALDPRPSDRVLEVGTGSGYQAAVLARLVAEVYTVEIVPKLAESATATLSMLGFTNVHVRAGDGYAGWTEAAPFDAIIVTCAPEKPPPPLIEQLKNGGRMVIPVGGSGNQDLVLLRKEGGKLRQESLLPVRFVPMTGKAAEPAPSAKRSLP